MEIINELIRQLISGVKDQMSPSIDVVRRHATDIYQEWDNMARNELLANMEADESDHQTDTVRFRWRNARDVDKKPALQCRKRSYVPWVWYVRKLRLPWSRPSDKYLARRPTAYTLCMIRSAATCRMTSQRMGASWRQR